MKERFAVLLLTLLSSFQIFAGEIPDDCLADLSYLPFFLLKNDAGARDRLARAGGKELSTAFLEAKNKAAKVSSEQGCERAIESYLKAWRSGHLTIQPVNGETNDRRITVGNPELDYEPLIRLLSADTALLEINSFHPSAGQRLQSALMKRREELATRKNWIIDVRQNHGGSDSAYQPLLPWLLADDIVEVQLAFLATDDNIEATREVCELYAPGDNTCIAFMQPLIERMREAEPGSFVGAEDHEIEFIQIPESPFRQPERVAILMGDQCVSSCEQFLLTARQSFSVKLIGRSSKGNLDYSNLRPHMLPSGKRQLLYATSKSYRLPSMPVDTTGVMPDIYLPEPTSSEEWEEEVGRVQSWLEGGSLAPKEMLRRKR